LRGNSGGDSARQMYRVLARVVWIDEELSAAEYQFLEEFRVELGLEPEQAEQIQREFAPGGAIDYLHSLEEVYQDGVLDDWEREHLERVAATHKLDPNLKVKLESAYVGYRETLPQVVAAS
jgi:hypothetical protein